MAKIFDVQDWLKNHPNRNNFDLTHKVHGSYQFGKLYPVLCKPVVPTDSFRIDTAVSLRFTPMPFPTQSNMRVIFHYFYVRNKNIWKNWSNWLQGLEEHTPPYIDQPSSFYKDGSLADHLGIPTSYLSSSESYIDTFVPRFISHNGSYQTLGAHGFVPQIISNSSFSSFFTSFLFGHSTLLRSESLSPSFNGSNNFAPISIGKLFTPGLIASIFIPSKFSGMPETISLSNFSTVSQSAQSQLYYDSSRSFYVVFHSSPSVSSTGSSVIFPVDSVKYICSYKSDGSSSLVYESHFVPGGSSSDSVIRHFDDDSSLFCTILCPCLSDDYSSGNVLFPVDFSSCNFDIFRLPQHVSLTDYGVVTPYASSGDTAGKVKVSALPFRAYESIYNAFYRNSQGVQPFQINGVTQYNKYVTNDDDGSDTTNYDLFERNWELDAYTSCLISPQQGNVPYVGITDISALGRMHVETPEGDSAEVRLSDNGDGVEISNLRGDTPEARAYALRAASSGFTIPEFREANSLQRFLEMNIRKGYKYIDFIEGHFGKKPTYSEMDMPEFIGGFSQRISVNEISNTNGVDNDTLGAIAGQARAIGGSKHGINHYFDDFGFVVGIMCIVPDNAYDSILPKHFNLKNPLDCYFPEFSQLSYMPLTHEELAPIQTLNDPRGSAYRDLTKVFGYQRPNHDLVWYPDTVHGLFRDASGIGNSVICRRFGVRPDLSDAFLRIKPEETDTIFNYTFGDNDVALGEVVLSIKAKRPIPRLVVPTIS